jgi:hypothetical protein
MATVMVDVEVDEVLEQIETIELLNELHSRAEVGDRLAVQMMGQSARMMERALEHLRAGSTAEAIEALTLGTGGSTSFDVRQAWREASTGEHPFLRVVGRK